MLRVTYLKVGIFSALYQILSNFIKFLRPPSRLTSMVTEVKKPENTVVEGVLPNPINSCYGLFEKSSQLDVWVSVLCIRNLHYFFY